MDRKVVLITGAAGKLGESLSKSILENNGIVVMADINSDKLFKIAKTFPSNRVLTHCCNASKKEDLILLTELAFQKFGKIDAAIHCSYPKSKSWGTSFENLEFENLKDDLRRAGYVTRDAREVERKKVGLRKARKRPQFSKR